MPNFPILPSGPPAPAILPLHGLAPASFRRELDHDEFASNRSKFIVIDFIMSERDMQMSLRNPQERDCARKPGSAFPPPVLISVPL
jgi:hypothetical protein